MQEARLQLSRGGFGTYDFFMLDIIDRTVKALISLHTFRRNTQAWVRKNIPPEYGPSWINWSSIFVIPYLEFVNANASTKTSTPWSRPKGSSFRQACRRQRKLNGQSSKQCMQGTRTPKHMPRSLFLAYMALMIANWAFSVSCMLVDIAMPFALIRVSMFTSSRSRCGTELLLMNSR